MLGRPLQQLCYTEIYTGNYLSRQAISESLHRPGHSLPAPPTKFVLGTTGPRSLLPCNHTWDGAFGKVQFLALQPPFLLPTFPLTLAIALHPYYWILLVPANLPFVTHARVSSLEEEIYHLLLFSSPTAAIALYPSRYHYLWPYRILLVPRCMPHITHAQVSLAGSASSPSQLRLSWHAARSTFLFSSGKFKIY